MMPHFSTVTILTPPRRTFRLAHTGAPWKDMPSRYGAYQTVHRQFQSWVQDVVLEKLLLSIAKDLQELARIFHQNKKN